MKVELNQLRQGSLNPRRKSEKNQIRSTIWLGQFYSILVLKRKNIVILLQDVIKGVENVWLSFLNKTF